MGRGRWQSHGKISQFIPSFMFGNSICSSYTDTKLLPTLSYKHFFLKMDNLIINWTLLSYATYFKDYPHHLTEYEGKGAKVSILKLFCKLGKICKFRLAFSKISIFHLINWKKLGSILYTS